MLLGLHKKMSEPNFPWDCLDFAIICPYCKETRVNFMRQDFDKLADLAGGKSVCGSFHCKKCGAESKVITKESFKKYCTRCETRAQCLLIGFAQWSATFPMKISMGPD